ncbi:MAG: glycoside hydrolase family 140 protein [Prevotellaceae bacterium]|nr:glycoside hydrolase family 140 protein [Prevotellaceae bacterium]
MSENGRYLQYSDGTPFFYLGDTAWELFHRLDREEADLYLEDRAKKGYTVIQAVALSELDGHVVPNPYGFLPLTDLDPARPALREGADNDYWDHVDYVVNKANSLGMLIGLLPTWGRYWNDGKPLFNKENAESYGKFLGQRYKDAGIIWILGGDRNPDTPEKKEIIRAMARGLKAGDEGNHLTTFHPTGWSGSAQWFHDEDWLDFNMRQNGHEVLYSRRYSSTLADYDRRPVKPVIDGEPLYEDHPVCFNPGEMGHSVSADVRRAMYWDLFNGACGHTYGHHSVWQMFDPEKGRNPINNPLMSWKEAIHQPGAGQMKYGRQLMESRPYLSRIPDATAIVPDKVQTSVPGEGLYHFSATRDEEGTYLMVYVPTGRKFTVRTDIIKGKKIKAWWYDPRNGRAKKAGTFSNQGQKEFISPTPGEMTDWILVLDDASFKYPPPGSVRHN